MTRIAVLGAGIGGLPRNPARNVTQAWQGRWVHYARIVFEKYFLRKTRKGQAQPVYEKLVLRMPGIRSLEERAA